MKKYTPPIPVETYIDEYLAAIFQHPRHQVGDNPCPGGVKDRAYELIPATPPMHPATPRVIAAGAVYCAFILCGSCITITEFSKISERDSRLQPISAPSISKAAHYIKDSNELDITW